jgi:hypothetical protein
MQLGSTGSIDLTTLIGSTRFHTSTLDNTSAFTDAQIIAVLNIKYRELQAFILSEIMNDWKENTVNGTSTGLINLVSGTNSYSFPTDMMSIDRLEINYTGTTNNYVPVEIKMLATIKPAISNTTGNIAISGTKNSPIAWVRDGKIYIDPIADVNVTGGLKVWCTSLISDLAAASPTGEPVFNKAFHNILPLLASSEWLENNDQQNKANIKMQKAELLKREMINFYSSRDSDSSVKVERENKNFR